MNPPGLRSGRTRKAPHRRGLDVSRRQRAFPPQPLCGPGDFVDLSRHCFDRGVADEGCEGGGDGQGVDGGTRASGRVAIGRGESEACKMKQEERSNRRGWPLLLFHLAVAGFFSAYRGTATCSCASGHSVAVPSSSASLLSSNLNSSPRQQLQFILLTVSSPSFVGHIKQTSRFRTIHHRNRPLELMNTTTKTKDAAQLS